MIFELLLIALVITLEPIPLTAFILVLASEGGVRKGAAFIFGWLLSLAAVVALTVVATGNNPPKPATAPSLAALALKLLIGAVLVVIGLRRRARMGLPKEPKNPPKWQSGIDNMSPWLVIGLAPLTQPWGLVAAGVAVIMEAKLSSWESYVGLFLFCLVATGVYLVMEVYAGFRAERAQSLMRGIRTWIDAHTDQVIVVLSLGLGFWLVGKSIYQLVAS
jgi:threonine/homoserine/homoserine lactone efflux protein